MRRYGGLLAGMLVGFPVMTTPVAFFMAVEQGAEFAEESALGILLTVPAVSMFAIGYSLAASRASWREGWAAGIAAYFAVSIATVQLRLDILPAAVLAAVVIALGLFLMGRPPVKAPARAAPWWDVWGRMLITLLLVLAVTAAANVMGPRWSSIPASYPAITSVVIPFTHARDGRDAAMAMARGMLLSHIAFAVLFVLAASLIADHGVVPAYAMATAVALTCSGLVITIDRWLARWRRASG
jgi:hypothetical protein